MGIDEINAMGAGIVCGGIEIESVVRKGSVVLCDSVTFPIEKVFVEFEDEHLAISFVEGIKTETAIIARQEEYELAQVSGDKERIEEVLTILWEEYGIHGKNPPARETSGIKRLAIMHDDGVNAFGFKHPNILLEWMIANGFPVGDINLALYDLSQFK